MKVIGIDFRTNKGHLRASVARDGVMLEYRPDRPGNKELWEATLIVDSIADAAKFIRQAISHEGGAIDSVGLARVLAPICEMVSLASLAKT